MARRRGLLVLLAAAVALGACVRSPAGTIRKPSGVATAGPAAPPALASNGPVGVVSNAGSGVVSNNSGNIVANNGGGLAGAVSAPAAMLASAGILANNVGGLVTDHGSARRILALDPEVPAPGVEVRLVDATGADVLDDKGKPFVALTDAKGHYAFAVTPGGRHVLLKVALGAAGRLEGLATKDRVPGATVDLDVVSTLATAYIVDRYVKPQADAVHVLDRLPADVERQTRAVTAASLAATNLAGPPALTDTQVVATIDGLRKADAKLDSQLETVRQLLVVGGSASQTDGSALAAALNQPRGVAVDDDGTVYFTDAIDNLVRKLTPDGHVVTVAGSGTAANTDGNGLTAAFNNPYGLALDGQGHLYVTCAGAVIRRLDLRDPAVPVTTIAGVGKAGHANGPGASAAFSNPLGLAVDRRDPQHLVLYVADAGNHRIRAIDLADPAYAVTDLAGTGKAGAQDGDAQQATFQNPQGLAVTPDGGLALTDPANHRVRRVDLVAAGHPVTTLAGSGVSGTADGPGDAASFIWPAGLALAGPTKLWVTDMTGELVRAIDLGDATHPVTTLAGATKGYADGQGAAAKFNSPQAIAVDTHGNAFVGDAFNNMLREITPAGLVTTVAGNIKGTAIDGQGTGALLNAPRGVAVGPDGTVYVADTFSHVIRAIDGAGNVTTLAGTAGKGFFAEGAGTAAAFFNPYKVAYDGRDPAHPGLFIADSYNHRIRRLDLSDPTYPVTPIAGSGTPGLVDGPGASAELNQPVGLALDPAGVLYVGDAKNFAVRRIDLNDPTYPVTTVAGNGQVGKADGPGASASFNLTYGLALAGTRLYVADSFNETIRRIDLADPTHPVTTIAGTPGHAGTTDGPGGTATFNVPQDLALDARGRLVVADTNNHLIRRIDVADPTYPVTTLAGTPGVAGSAGGTAATASFSKPAGVAVGPNGDLYVADTANNRVLDIGPVN